MSFFKSFSIPSEQLIDNYRITKKIGNGYEGEVYLALEKNDGKLYALKLYRPDEFGLKQMKQIEKTHRKMNSIDAVVKYFGYNYCLRKKAFYAVFEYIDGESFGDMADASPLPPKQALEVLHVVADMLCQAAEAAQCFGDIHPWNIIKTSKGDIRLIDPDWKVQFGASALNHDITKTCKLLYELCWDTTLLTSDIRRALPKREDAILRRYNHPKELLQHIIALKAIV